MPISAAFPSSVASFTEKFDLIDVVFAAHINALQAEVVAIESTLGTSPQGTSASVKARIAAAETSIANLQAKYNGSGRLPESSVEGLVADLAAINAALGSGLVHTTGNETIGGIKTFTSKPVAPNIPVTGSGASPVADGQLAFDLAANHNALIVRQGVGQYRALPVDLAQHYEFSTTGPTSGTNELALDVALESTYNGPYEADTWMEYYGITKTVASDTFELRLYKITSGGSGTATVVDRRKIPAGATDFPGGSFHRVVSVATIDDSPLFQHRIVRTSGTGTATINLGGQVSMNPRWT